MVEDVRQSMFYIGLVYIFAMCILVPLMIYYLTHKRDVLDTRWWWPLGFIILMTILVGVSEGALASELF
jgi:uncharacterized integral membrane protein